MCTFVCMCVRVCAYTADHSHTFYYVARVLSAAAISDTQTADPRLSTGEKYARQNSSSSPSRRIRRISARYDRHEKPRMDLTDVEISPTSVFNTYVRVYSGGRIVLIVNRRFRRRFLAVDSGRIEYAMCHSSDV